MPTNKESFNEIKDCPSEDIIILDTVVQSNPFRIAISELLFKEWKLHHENRKKELVLKAL